MAVPVLSDDITQIDNADAGTNWSGWGINSSKWDDEEDLYVEGAGSQSCQPNASGGTGGWGVDTSAQFPLDLSATGNKLFIWVYAAYGFVGTAAQKGVHVRICTSTTSWTTEYNDYVVGGSDILWTDKGFHLIALDCSRTPDADVGTTTLTNINRVGVGFYYTKTSTKSSVQVIDAIAYGTYIEAVGVTSSSASHSFTASTNTITRSSGDFSADGFEVGDTIEIAGTVNNDGEFVLATVGTTTMTTTGGIADETTVTSTIDAYITLEDIYTKDGPTDGNWFGVVTQNSLGLFEINYDLIVGDQSGSGRTYFDTRGEVIYFADQPLDPTLSIAEDTGETVFKSGRSSGTGDNRVGFGGSIFAHYNDYQGQSAAVDLSAAITLVEVYGTTFLNIGGGVSFAADTTHKVFNTSFNVCGQIDLGSAEARKLVFAGYDGAADAALLWSGSINIKNSSFLANLNSGGNAAAIEHPAAGTFYYYDLIFAGNDYDINFSAASGDLTIYAVGTSNPSTSEKVGSGTVSIIATTTHTLTGMQQNTEVTYVGSGGGVLFHVENVTLSGVTQFPYNYSETGDFVVDILIHHLNYEFYLIEDLTLDDTDATIPITQIYDINYFNPS